MTYAYATTCLVKNCANDKLNGYEVLITSGLHTWPNTIHCKTPCYRVTVASGKDKGMTFYAVPGVLEFSKYPPHLQNWVEPKIVNLFKPNVELREQIMLEND